LRGLPGQIDRDAQQTTGAARHLDQVVTQAGDGLLNDFLQCHVIGSIPEKQKTREPPEASSSKS
jgi:hypothetical protein